MSTVATAPTDQQREILARLNGPLRIAAGAGTGKTDTLKRAIVALIGDGVRPGEILCLTFGVEAAKEMRRRVFAAFENREGVDADELTVQTYHAFGASIVREHALLAGLDGDPALLDHAQKWQLVLEALDRCRFGVLDIPWLPTLIKNLLGLHEEMQRHVVSVSELASWCRARPADDETSRQRLDALTAVHAYAEVKREHGAIDYGDQIGLAAWLLDVNEDVRDRLRARYRYVFLDEYQDTDVAQRKLVRLVGEGARLICAVGDVDQGIFGWRGATIFNMAAFPLDFRGARTLPLSTNFRSGKTILELANALVEGFERPAGDVREPLTPVDGAPRAMVEAFVAAHQNDEAAEIAERILAGGEPWGRYAALCRKRSLFDPIFRALADRGVPVQADMLGGFWKRPEILDVDAWLHLLADPGDNISLTRILLGPAYRLDRRDLFFLADRAKGETRAARRDRRGVLRYSLVDAIVGHEEIPELSDLARERIAAFHRTWCELATVAARSSLADLVGEIARITGLAAELAASPDPEAEVALRHLAKLRDIAQGFEPAAGSGDLAGFVAYLDSVEESEHDEDELRTVDPNAVRLMTLHRAKGLEWDVVFVPGLAFRVMPSEHASENPARCWQRLPFELRGDAEFLPAEDDAEIKAMKLDEERRLMYVGVTRAKRRLVLSRAWFYFDNKTAKAPSVFWDEALGTGLVKLTGEQVECPEANPFVGALDAEPAVSRVPSPPPDPAEIARLEPVVERLRAAGIARPRAARWHCPPVVSVTAFLTFARDEEEFYCRYVRRVPAPPSPAARLGIELHRRIEEWSRGGRVEAAPPDEFGDEPYDLDVGERRGDGSGGAAVSEEQMWENFQRSRFAQMTPTMVEQPFTLYLGEGLSVTGRIDAVFARHDGTWEIVDYKSGVSEPDPLQLAIYARAVDEIWSGVARTGVFFLRSGNERRIDPPDARSDIGAAAHRLREFA